METQPARSVQIEQSTTSDAARAKQHLSLLARAMKESFPAKGTVQTLPSLDIQHFSAQVREDGGVEKNSEQAYDTNKTGLILYELAKQQGKLSTQTLREAQEMQIVTKITTERSDGSSQAVMYFPDNMSGKMIAYQTDKTTADQITEEDMQQAKEIVVALNKQLREIPQSQQALKIMRLEHDGNTFAFIRAPNGNNWEFPVNVQPASERIAEELQEISSLNPEESARRLDLLTSWMQEQGLDTQAVKDYRLGYLSLPAWQRDEYQKWMKEQPTGETEPVAEEQTQQVERQIIGTERIVAIDAHTGKVLDKLTSARTTLDRDLGEYNLSKVTLFDFSQLETFHDTLVTAEEMSKLHLRRKLKKYNLPSTHIDRLTPVYCNPSGNHAGETTNGIIQVFSVLPDRPLHTALVTAHELSHASAGRTFTYRSEKSDPLQWINQIDGLAHYNRRRNKSQGDMLENALARWDQSEVYTELTPLEAFQKEARDREALLANILNRRDDLIPEYFKENKITDRIRAAKQLGIPDNMILSGIDYLHEDTREHLDQVIIIWKLSRIIGKTLLPKNDLHIKDSAYLVQLGRRFLETSRYSGSDEAIQYINQIFKEKAVFLLGGDDHSYDNAGPLIFLKRMERKMGLFDSSEEKQLEFSLY